METIAEINDLACQAIEYGDYRIALDVLNSCLGCVKQLKRYRTSSMTEERIDRTNNLNISADERRKTIVSPADEGRKTTIETIARLLKGTKRKLMNRTAAEAARATAFASRNNNNNKRKLRTDTSIAAAVIETSSRVGERALPLKKRRRSTPDENPGEVQPVPPREAAATTVETTTTDSSGDSKCSSTVVSNCSATVSVSPSNLDHGHNSPNQPPCCPSNHESEQRFFVYCKPLRLTKFQWYLIRQNSKINGEQEHESQCHIDREIELAVSSNLIFNIALTHHMIAFPTTNPRGERPEFLPNEDGETDDDDTDDETGFEESAFQTSSLKTTPRLKGALRLYELGFRVHTKRVAYIISMSSPSASLSPRGSRTVSFHSLAQDRARMRARDDELKSTTRFVLALLNNCCHIHQELGQTEKAKIFQNRLLSFILVIIDSGSSVHDIVGDDPALEGYLKNVFDGTVFHRDNGPAAVA